MIQFLHFADFLLVGLCTLLEFAFFFYLTKPQFKTLKFFMLYCGTRNIVLVPFLFLSMKAYAYAYWSTQGIKLVWLAWIAANVIGWYSGFRFDEGTKLVAKIPAVIVFGMTVYFLTVPGTTKNAQTYETTAWSIILVTVVTGAILSVRDRTGRIALGISCLSAVGFAANLVWARMGYQAKTWEAGMLVALIAVAVSLVNGRSRSAPGRVLNVFRATQNGS